MSMISEQVRTLREYADGRKGEIASLCRGAADTIEVLSAKVRANNLHGGWIPVSEKLPDKDGRYLVTYPIGGDDIPWVNVLHYGDVEGIRWFYESDYEWGDLIYDDAVAWMPLPETYGGEDHE